MDYNPFLEVAKKLGELSDYERLVISEILKGSNLPITDARFSNLTEASRLFKDHSFALATYVDHFISGGTLSAKDAYNIYTTLTFVNDLSIAKDSFRDYLRTYSWERLDLLVSKANDKLNQLEVSRQEVIILANTTVSDYLVEVGYITNQLSRLRGISYNFYNSDELVKSNYYYTVVITPSYFYNLENLSSTTRLICVVLNEGNASKFRNLGSKVITYG